MTIAGIRSPTRELHRKSGITALLPLSPSFPADHPLHHAIRFAVTGLASLLPALASRRLAPAAVLRKDQGTASLDALLPLLSLWTETGYGQVFAAFRWKRCA